MSGAGAMERLWASWRAVYLEGPGRCETEAGSVFSRILASGLGDDETYIVWRGSAVFAILNRYPYTSGHVLVMPYREVPALEELTSAEHDELWASVTDAVIALRAAYRPEGVNVGLNLGEAAGAGVPTHLHAHVVPRWSADTNFMTAIAETRVLPEALAVTWEKLRAAWPRPGARPLPSRR
ncbi:MAG: HIT family protein [Acidimicrobiia bacterium]